MCQTWTLADPLTYWSVPFALHPDRGNPRGAIRLARKAATAEADDDWPSALDAMESCVFSQAACALLQPEAPMSAARPAIAIHRITRQPYRGVPSLGAQNGTSALRLRRC